jgi:hypothetical protein
MESELVQVIAHNTEDGEGSVCMRTCSAAKANHDKDSLTNRKNTYLCRPPLQGSLRCYAAKPQHYATYRQPTQKIHKEQNVGIP